MGETIVAGESGEIYVNIHVDGPIDQGGGTDILSGPVESTPAA